MAEKYSGIVIAEYLSASCRNFRASTIHAVQIPARHPTATQIPERPVAYTRPVNPRSSQADSPVARSDRASIHPGSFDPPMTKSLCDFVRMACHNPNASVSTK